MDVVDASPFHFPLDLAVLTKNGELVVSLGDDPVLGGCRPCLHEERQQEQGSHQAGIHWAFRGKDEMDCGQRTQWLVRHRSTQSRVFHAG